MAKRVRIEWNVPAFEELRRDPRVVSDLESRANRIADAAGPGYEASVGQGKSRARGGVYTQSYEAMRDSAKNNTLIKSLDAGK